MHTYLCLYNTILINNTMSTTNGPPRSETMNRRHTGHGQRIRIHLYIVRVLGAINNKLNYNVMIDVYHNIHSIILIILCRKCGISGLSSCAIFYNTRNTRLGFSSSAAVASPQPVVSFARKIYCTSVVYKL